MAFFGNLINDIIKLPEKTSNILGNIVSDVKSTVITFAPKVGDFIRDVPGNITRTVDTSVDFAMKQANKIVDLQAGALGKMSGAIGEGLGKIGAPLLNNPVLGGVALSGSGSMLLLAGAAAIAAIFVLKKF